MDRAASSTSQSAREPLTLTTAATTDNDSAPRPKVIKHSSNTRDHKTPFSGGGPHISLLMGAGLGAQLLTGHCCEVVSRLIYQERCRRWPLICHSPPGGNFCCARARPSSRVKTCRKPKLFPRSRSSSRSACVLQFPPRIKTLQNSPATVTRL